MDPQAIPRAIAPGEFVVFHGSGIGPASEATSDLKAEGGAPENLAGVRLLVGGRAMPLLSVSENRIAAIVPFSVAGQEKILLEVERNGAIVAAAEVPVTTAVPAIFGPDGPEYRPSAVFNQDWTLNSGSNPATPGEVITVFVSGAGALAPAPTDGAIIPSGDLPKVEDPVQAFISGAGYQVVTFAG